MFAVSSTRILSRMVAEDISSLLEEIEELLRQPPSGGPAAAERIEQTLTDGYAHALELEAERWRVERQIADLAKLLAGGDEGRADELSRLYARLASTDAEVKRLRGTLATLRRHVDAVRAA